MGALPTSREGLAWANSSSSPTFARSRLFHQDASKISIHKSSQLEQKNVYNQMSTMLHLFAQRINTEHGPIRSLTVPLLFVATISLFWSLSLAISRAFAIRRRVIKLRKQDMVLHRIKLLNCQTYVASPLRRTIPSSGVSLPRRTLWQTFLRTWTHNT